MNTTQGNDNNIGVYSSKKPANTPDTDSIYIDLSDQGINVTPDVRFRHARMRYSWRISITSNTPVNITFNTIINWSNNSLYDLLLDNSNSAQALKFNFSLDYSFLDDNLSASRLLIVAPGQRIKLYMSLISGKIYCKKSINSDPLIYG